MTDIASRVPGRKDPNFLVISKLREVERIESVLELGRRAFGGRGIKGVLWNRSPPRVAFRSANLICLGVLHSKGICEIADIRDGNRSANRIESIAVSPKNMNKISEWVSYFIQISSGKCSRVFGVLEECVCFVFRYLNVIFCKKQSRNHVHASLRRRSVAVPRRHDRHPGPPWTRTVGHEDVWRWRDRHSTGRHHGSRRRVHLGPEATASVRRAAVTSGGRPQKRRRHKGDGRW